MVNATVKLASASATAAGVVALVSENYVCPIVPMQVNASTACVFVLKDTAILKSLQKKKTVALVKISAQTMENAILSHVNVPARHGLQGTTAPSQSVRADAPVTDHAFPEPVHAMQGGLHMHATRESVRCLVPDMGPALPANACARPGMKGRAVRFYTPAKKMTPRLVPGMVHANNSTAIQVVYATAVGKAPLVPNPSLL